MKTEGKFILNGTEVVPCDDLIEWAQWMEENETQIRVDRFGDGYVSTIFLGLDCSSHIPKLFETMSFHFGTHNKIEQYSTYEEAIAGHNEIVEEIKKAIK